ncbi:MAG: ATP-binding protein [bacterium]
MKSQSFHILMIEDNPDHAALSKKCLENVANYSVQVVPSYPECCQALQKQSFDIILLDYHLPAENGLTILNRLKTEEKIDTPIVVVTGHGHEKLAVEAMKAGAFDYVMKTKEYPEILPSVVKTVSEKFQVVQEKRRMEREILVRNSELQVLNAIAEEVNQSLDLDKILRGAVTKINQLMELDYCAIFMYDHSSEKFHLKAEKGALKYSHFFACNGRQKNNMLQQFKLRESPLMLNDISEKLTNVFSANNGSVQPVILYNPLMHEKNYFGALLVASENRDAFPHRFVELMNAISNQLGVAIENAKLYYELNKAKDSLENVLNSSLDLIVTIKEDGSLNFYNQRFADFYHLSNSTHPGHNFFNYLPAESKKLFQKKLQPPEMAESSSYEMELHRVDGSNMPCIVSQSPLKGRDEYLLVIKDISQIKQLQQQLIQSEKLSALGQMIAGVAHELNNPLAGIMGFSQLLLEGELSTPVSDDIQVIYKEATRCQKIVKNLLTFAKKQTSERQHLNVNEVLNNILDIQRYQFKVESIELIRDFDSHLPEIVGDYNQLQQVFLNLLHNALFALKSSDNLHKQLKVRTRHCNDIVRIEIIDNGIGIPKENQKRIFDPFYTTRDVGQGTGLGLSICYGIVQSHQGHLSVESQPGNGSTFIVDFSVKAS